MNSSSHSSANGKAETSASESAAVQPSAPADKSAHGMSTRTRLLFYLTAWLIVLLPFLFWWNTWFGRQLPDKQIAEYLRDDTRPRHIQHALVQIGDYRRDDTRPRHCQHYLVLFRERIMGRYASVAQWFP